MKSHFAGKDFGGKKDFGQIHIRKSHFAGRDFGEKLLWKTKRDFGNRERLRRNPSQGETSGTERKFVEKNTKSKRQIHLCEVSLRRERLRGNNSLILFIFFQELLYQAKQGRLSRHLTLFL